jgi:hypothetical protein
MVYHTTSPDPSRANWRQKRVFRLSGSKISEKLSGGRTVLPPGQMWTFQLKTQHKYISRAFFITQHKHFHPRTGNTVYNMKCLHKNILLFLYERHTLGSFLTWRRRRVLWNNLLGWLASLITTLHALAPCIVLHTDTTVTQDICVTHCHIPGMLGWKGHMCKTEPLLPHLHVAGN